MVLWITGLTALWITRAVLAVDYVASPLWISQPFGLGRICPHLTVLWMSGLVRSKKREGEEKWGLASPPHPSGRTESCTLRILRMLLPVLTEGVGEERFA